MSPMPTILNRFEIGTEPTDAVVVVKLNSIEHVAARGDQVDNDFTVELTISDGGANQIGKFGPETITVKPGNKKQIQQTIFIGEYENKCNSDVGEITFKFEAETDYVANQFIGVTTGDNTLKEVGAYHFKAPVKLEQGSNQSTLVFRGRIDVSC